MEFLGIIPARSGSKGIKNKNIIKIGDTNLVRMTYKFATRILPQDRIILSTDYKYNIFSDFLKQTQYRERPINLCSDNASIIDVCIDTLKFIKDKLNQKITEIILLQPTSPIRNHKNLEEAISLYKEKSLTSLASVSKVIQNPYEIIEGCKDKWKPITKWDGHKNRQELKTKYFFINGNFYIFNINNLLKNKSIINENTYMFETSEKYSIDIDDEQDLKLIKKIFN